jgi:hypothetical protein
MKTKKQTFFPSLPLFPLLLTFLTLLLTNVATAQVPYYVPTNGLVGYWPFNGNANDESGNGNNGTVNGATLSADRFGDLGKAFSFDGVDDFIYVSSAFYDISINHSINIWVSVADLNNVAQYLWNTSPHPGEAFVYNWGAVDNNVTYCLGNGTNGLWTITCGVENDFLSNSQNEWHLYSMVYENGNWSIYVDGQLSSTYANSNLPSGIYSIYFGDIAFSDYHETINGSLDDIGIWNRALTADEVLALYNGCNVAPLTVSGNVTPTQFTQETYTYPNTVGSTYNWTVTNGVIVSGQGTNSIDVTWANTGIGSVSVVETNASNCSGDVVNYDVVVIPTDVEEFSATISLFPNPATNEINIQTTTELIGSDLIIFDALGKQIHKQQILSTNTRINTSAFAAGNYVVKAGGVVKRFEVRK